MFLYREIQNLRSSALRSRNLYVFEIKILSSLELPVTVMRSVEEDVIEGDGIFNMYSTSLLRGYLNASLNILVKINNNDL